MFFVISDYLEINDDGHLLISGCDTVKLAEKYGTPLYVMSEDKIREVCRNYISSFQKYYDGRGVPTYASKAFCCKEICRIVASEGFDVEVVSGGELYTALQAGISPAKIHFQGNNKTCGELILAIENKVGDIVVDNFSELHEIQRISEENNVVTDITMRIKPGIDAHTHEFIRTGQIDSKFGVSLETGEAYEMAKTTAGLDNVKLKGIHCHIGSQILDSEPFVLAAEVMLDLFAKINSELHVNMQTLNLGGGFGVKYVNSDIAAPYESYMEKVSAAVKQKCANLNIEIPYIILEPGRSVVAESGITLYTVGNIKEIPDIRNYVAVDGGMFENPRYALYSADYTCVVANKANLPADYIATIAGKCCESGDLIQEHTMIQQPAEGDILAVLCTGAYNYSMASNYNRNLKPACVMVSQGESRIVIKAETYEDLLRNDV